MWVRWPDFWLPSDPDEALAALTRAHELAGSERVEVTCAVKVRWQRRFLHHVALHR